MASLLEDLQRVNYGKDLLQSFQSIVDLKNRQKAEDIYNKGKQKVSSVLSEAKDIFQQDSFTEESYTKVNKLIADLSTSDTPAELWKPTVDVLDKLADNYSKRFNVGPYNPSKANSDTRTVNNYSLATADLNGLIEYTSFNLEDPETGKVIVATQDKTNSYFDKTLNKMVPAEFSVLDYQGQDQKPVQLGATLPSTFKDESGKEVKTRVIQRIFDKNKNVIGSKILTLAEDASGYYSLKSKSDVKIAENASKTEDQKELEKTKFNNRLNILANEYKNTVKLKGIDFNNQKNMAVLRDILRESEPYIKKDAKEIKKIIDNINPNFISKYYSDDNVFILDDEFINQMSQEKGDIYDSLKASTKSVTELTQVVEYAKKLKMRKEAMAFKVSENVETPAPEIKKSKLTFEEIQTRKAKANQDALLNAVKGN